MALIVTLRALGLGDLLAAVPALRAIRRAFPRHEHALAAPAALAPLAALTGAVDRTVDARPLAPLPAELRGADVLVNLHGRGPESHLVALAAAPQRLVAFAHADVPRTRGAPAWRAREHERDRWCRLLRESGIPADPGDVLLPAPERPPPPAALGATIVHPGAASPARCWPPERFAVLAAEERRAGRRVVVTGSAAERPLAERVAALAGLPRDAVLAGETDLLGLAASVAAAGRVVSGDTGIAHLAVAFATPSLTLFGPTSPDEWGPPSPPALPASTGAQARHHALWRGRRGDPHGERVDRGLYEIGAEEALAALARVS